MEAGMIALYSWQGIVLLVLATVGLVAVAIGLSIGLFHKRRSVTLSVHVLDDEGQATRSATYHGHAYVHWAEYGTLPVVAMVQLKGRGPGVLT